MDSRAALPNHTTLSLRDGRTYTILRELGRGGTGIVYDACYTDSVGEQKTVRIKECYPFKCSLRRDSTGALTVPAAEAEAFAQAKEKMLRAYRLGNSFFYTDGLTNFTANTYDLVEANQTLYMVSAYVQGQKLSYDSYPSVKDSIAAVRSVANTILKLHNLGYLYLDMKPGNILILNGTTELVQLFDFDTVLPLSEIACLEDKISYTKGFAALELQAGNSRRIGRHTDVYGIGALLYYVLFDRVPDAFDCEPHAKYDFSSSKLSGFAYQDQLIFRLTDFFHHTLADYYLDRFSNMETVVERLSELQALADRSVRYVVSSRLTPPGLFLGRQTESQWVMDRLSGKPPQCFFIAGIGGIGKSSLVRHCLSSYRASIDSLVYLSYLGSLEKTLCDDYSLHINTVCWDRQETGEAYLTRKLGVLRTLGAGKNCILVIDNYTGDQSNAFSKLLQIGWTLIFLTRNRELAGNCPCLNLEPLADLSQQLELFSQNLGRELTEGEHPDATAIVQSVRGHTLTVGLVARQLSSPLCGLSIRQAAERIGRQGFSKIDSTQVAYPKDSVSLRDTVYSIISGLFAADTLTDTQQALLKVLSLFGPTGISADRFCEILALEGKADIETLFQQGWIEVADTVLSMHPVIREVISNWPLTQTARDDSIKALRYLAVRLKTQAKKEEYPKHLLRALQNINDLHQAAPNSPGDRLVQKILSGADSDLVQETYRARLDSCATDPATNHEEVHRLLRLAAAVLDSSQQEPLLCGQEAYLELLYATVQNTPYENGDFLREKAQELISRLQHGNERVLLLVYQTLLELFYERGEFEKARHALRQARLTISGNLSPQVWGRYYYLLAGYYDSALGGAYAPETEEERRILHQLLCATDKAIGHLRLSGAGDTGILLGECYRLKALVLIRSGLGKRRTVCRILEKVRRLIDKYAQPNSRLVRDHNLTMAWYHTYLDPNYPQTCAYLFKAYDITKVIQTSELSIIDDQLSPMANIMLEWHRYDEAELYLLRAIWACAPHLEIAAYARRQVELLEHLLEVYQMEGNDPKCQAVRRLLDKKAAGVGVVDVKSFISEEVRELVKNQIAIEKET